MGGFESGGFDLAARVRTTILVVAGCFFGILLRLWYLQVLRADYFKEQSENNRLRESYIPPPRGMILDRNGVVLARSRPAFNVELVKEDAPDPAGVLRRLAEVVGLPADELTAKLAEPQLKRRRFEPRLILKDVSRDMVAKIAARKWALPGITVTVVPAREYVYGELAAQTLGYIGEISADQLSRPGYAGYRRGDLVGQSGVERAEEYFLQGRRGIQGLIVDAAGNRIQQAYFVPEQAGHNVTLTLDYALQSAAEEALAGRKGAVVALNPENGEVLALVSKPAFNANLFSAGLGAQTWRSIQADPDRPLLNRAVQGLYHPGSVFKFVVASAGLAEQVTTSSERVFCRGVYQVAGSRPFACHHRHGAVNLHDALKVSCNVYFYTIGQRLGVDRIHEYGTRFGFGIPAGLGLGDEPAGLVPSTAWKRALYKNPAAGRWYPGETPSVAIGQGAVVVTPLQMARALAALVNGGVLLRPRLITAIKAQNGTFENREFHTEVQGRLGIEPRVLAAVREGLTAVVNERGGTGSRAKLPPDLGVTVGGKTGTAQVRELRGTKTLALANSLAWFAGFAPAEKAELVVVALVEGGGHGGVAAAPVVQQVMLSYFGRKAGGAPAPAPSAAAAPTADGKGRDV